ncbi:MAG: hypothetical protein SCH66_14705 [Methanolobus sp.]|nr:hypothetical protein [Methanolobus sp.]
MNIHKSVSYPEPIYEEPDFRPGKNQWEQSAQLVKKQGLYPHQIKTITAITLHGGDRLKYILRQHGAESQYRLLMHACKVMGVDRPCIKNYTYLSTEQQKELIRRYVRGASTRELKDYFKVHDSTIYRLTKDVTREVNPVIFPKSSFTKEQLATMFQLHKRGETVSAIGRFFDRNPRSIRKIIVKRTNKNLTERTHILVSESEAEYMKELYNSGKGVTEIGKLSQRSATTVRNVVDPGNEKPRVNFTETELAELKEEFQKGTSIAECSKKFNRGYNAIKYRFKQFEKK